MQRRPAHAELSALHKAMNCSFGFKVQALKPPENFILRPLEPAEERVPAEDGHGFQVRNLSTGDAKPEIPRGRRAEFTASFFADQGTFGNQVQCGR